MPKRKGTPGGNPSPVQTADLKAKQYQRVDRDERPLDSRTTGVKLFAEDATLLRSSLPDSQERAAWMRRVIHAAVVAELKPIAEEQKLIVDSASEP